MRMGCLVCETLFANTLLIKSKQIFPNPFLGIYTLTSLLGNAWNRFTGGDVSCLTGSTDHLQSRVHAFICFSCNWADLTRLEQYVSINPLPIAPPSADSQQLLCRWGGTFTKYIQSHARLGWKNVGLATNWFTMFVQTIFYPASWNQHLWTYANCLIV